MTTKHTSQSKTNDDDALDAARERALRAAKLPAGAPPEAREAVRAEATAEVLARETPEETAARVKAMEDACATAELASIGALGQNLQVDEVVRRAYRRGRADMAAERT